MVVVVIAIMIMMVWVRLGVKMIGSGGGSGAEERQVTAALDEQIEAKGDDEQPGDQLEPGDDQRGQDVMRGEQGDEAEDQHRAGMCEGDDAAKQDGIAGATARAHEVRADEGLAVPGCEGMQAAEGE